MALRYDQELRTGPMGEQDVQISASNSTRAMRACTNCVRAKARCSTTSHNNHKCDRCSRMNKDCRPSPPVKRRRTTAIPSSSNSGALEEKLGSLVDAIREATQSNHHASTAAVVKCLGLDKVLSRGDGDASTSSFFTSPSVSVQDPRNCIRPSIPTPATSVTAASPEVSLDPLSTPCEIRPADAEYYLLRFRQEFIPKFPIIVLPQSLTATQLRHDRPFLWLAIMTVASMRSTQQVQLSKHFRVLLGQELFVNGTRSLDLLLAILVYATWDRRYFFDKPILTSFVHSAIALLHDLGLSRPPASDNTLQLLCRLKGKGLPTRFAETVSLEERRALMGCFLLSTIPGEALRWTSYCEECLRVIETEKAEPTDELLSAIVRSSLLLEKVHFNPWSSVSGVAIYRKPPASLYVDSFLSQLRQLRASIPQHLMQNDTLMLELYYIEWRIYEIGLSKDPHLVDGSTNRRFEWLYACLQTLKTWCSAFLTIPPSRRLGTPAWTYTRMARSLVCMLQLHTCDFPEWDGNIVKESMDVPALMAVAEKNFAQVKVAANLDPEPSDDLDIYSIMASQLSAMKDRWNSLVATPDSDGEPVLWPEWLDFPPELIDM